MNDRFTPLDRIFGESRFRSRFDEDDLPEDELEGFAEVDLDKWDSEEEELFETDWRGEIGYDPLTARDDDWD